MKLKMENKKNVVFSFNVLGRGITIFKKEPAKPKTKKPKPRKFQYF